MYCFFFLQVCVEGNIASGKTRLLEYFKKFSGIVQVRLKNNNKCFSGHFFEKQMRQTGFICLFYFPKNIIYEATFFFHFIEN